MTRDELKRKYFNWMYNIVCGGDSFFKKQSYKKLLSKLNDVDFYAIIAMDENRAFDGINLRYRFGYEHSYDDRIIASYLDDKPCSVLEMILALAIRCEEHIMEDESMGDRTGQWFWDMITSLGLGSMYDSRYDDDYVNEKIEIFLERKYSKNGKGGLFTVVDSKLDLRTIEIWYQMHQYLNDII